MVKPNSDQKVLDGIVAGLRGKRVTAQLLEKQKGKATPPKAESGKEQATSPGSSGRANDPDDPDKDGEEQGSSKKSEKKTIDDILRDTKPGRKTHGRTKQFEKDGGFDEAVQDFESLNPENVRDIPKGKAGTLPDGRKVNVRTSSQDTRPTLEVYNPVNEGSIKIRYGIK